MGVLRLLSYMTIGAVLADGGVTWRGWHLYAVLLCIAIIDLVQFRHRLWSAK